jgi:DNA-binding NtrC family response regulator
MKAALPKRFFVVDDDPWWSAMLVQMLDNLGHYNVFVFNNGQDCLKSLDLDPGIIFLDYEMGDLNGLEVLKNIKEKHPKMNVVLCTSSDDIHLAVSAMRLGSYDFIQKQTATKTNFAYVIDGTYETLAT